MKDDIRLLTLNYLLNVYSQEDFLTLLNSNEEISEMLNVILLNDYNNYPPVVSFTIKEGSIDYMVGTNYKLSLEQTLNKVFLQLEYSTLLKLMLSEVEKLNK